MLILFFLFFKIFTVTCLNNGAALTPPQGWLSWEWFKCNIDCTNFYNCLSESLIKEIALIFVNEGYLDAGYNYINLDDCWMKSQRESNGQLLPDFQRFPNGIKHLANYLHKLGLKLGIYQNVGPTTCMGFPGSMNHLKIDAETFIDWGVDMIKMDGCLIESNTDFFKNSFINFGKYLNQSYKPIVYSCSWPYYQIHKRDVVFDFEKLAETCNLWRTYHDIVARWDFILNVIDFCGDNQKILTRFVGPGNWNDPDMLMIGHPGLTEEQCKAQMGIWSILAAPLLMSNDPRHLSKNLKAILLNKEVIKVNQDKYGFPGMRVFHNSSFDIWIRKVGPIVQNKYSLVVGFLNRKASNGHAQLSIHLKDIGVDTFFKFRDLFNHKDLGIYSSEEKLKVTIPPTGIVLVKGIPI